MSFPRTEWYCLMNKSELLNRIYHSWTDLRVFIEGLTEEQMTVPADAAGWTVKDHLIHLAVWASSVDALLSGQSRRERMGIESGIWRAGDVDAINAIIQLREKDRPLDDVLNTLQSVHQQVVTQVQAVTDDDLKQSIQHQSSMDNTRLEWIIWNTYEHYDEHIPWMDRIAHSR